MVTAKSRISSTVPKRSPRKAIAAEATTVENPAAVAPVLTNQSEVVDQNNSIAVPKLEQSASQHAKKQKVIRDEFRMPEGDYAMIAALKKKCFTLGVGAKKSELLRAGLQVLGGLAEAELLAAIAALQTTKADRKTQKRRKKG